MVFKLLGTHVSVSISKGTVMKMLTMLSLLTTVAVRLSAQGAFGFFNNTPVPLIDSITESAIEIETDPCAGNGFEVSAVNVNVMYPVTGLLSISVNGKSLSSFNGGDGANYINTTFVTLSTPDVTHVAQGEAPFTGTFAAESHFDDFSAMPIQGTWVLTVRAPADLFEGSIESWGITFQCLGSMPTSAITHESERLTLYPNPASDFIRIGTEAVDHVSIYSMQGQQVLYTTVEPGTRETMIDLERLGAGTYRVAAVSGARRYYTTLTVIR